MGAVRALKFQRSSYFFTIDKGLSTDFAFELTTATGIVVDVLVRSTAERAVGIARDITRFVFVRLYRFDDFAIAKSVVLIPKLPILFEEWFDDGKLIGEEFLVLGAVEFVMSPLF